METLEKLVKHHSVGIKSPLTEGLDQYVIVKGGESFQREAFVKELQLQINIPVYGEEQFPNSPGKIVVYLDVKNLKAF